MEDLHSALQLLKRIDMEQVDAAVCLSRFAIKQSSSTHLDAGIRFLLGHDYELFKERTEGMSFWTYNHWFEVVGDNQILFKRCKLLLKKLKEFLREEKKRRQALKLNVQEVSITAKPLPAVECHPVVAQPVDPPISKPMCVQELQVVQKVAPSSLPLNERIIKPPQTPPQKAKTSLSLEKAITPPPLPGITSPPTLVERSVTDPTTQKQTSSHVSTLPQMTKANSSNDNAVSFSVDVPQVDKASRRITFQIDLSDKIISDERKTLVQEISSEIKSYVDDLFAKQKEHFDEIICAQQVAVTKQYKELESRLESKFERFYNENRGFRYEVSVKDKIKEQFKMHTIHHSLYLYQEENKTGFKEARKQLDALGWNDYVQDVKITTDTDSIEIDFVGCVVDDEHVIVETTMRNLSSENILEKKLLQLERQIVFWKSCKKNMPIRRIALITGSRCLSRIDLERRMKPLEKYIGNVMQLFNANRFDVLRM